MASRKQLNLPGRAELSLTELSTPLLTVQSHQGPGKSKPRLLGLGSSHFTLIFGDLGVNELALPWGRGGGREEGTVNPQRLTVPGGKDTCSSRRQPPAWRDSLSRDPYASLVPKPLCRAKAPDKAAQVYPSCPGKGQGFAPLFIEHSLQCPHSH